MSRVADRAAYSAGLPATPTHVESHTLAPQRTPDFLKKVLARGVSHISYCTFFPLLNRVPVLLSGCVKSIIDDNRTFVNSLLKRGNF